MFLRRLDESVRAPEFAFLPPSVARGLIEMQFSAREAQYAASYPNAECSIVECGNTEAGYLLVDRSPQAVRIINIALLPEFRGRGVGTDLLKSVLEEGSPVWLQVRHDNPARRLYQRLGFQIVSQTDLDSEMRYEKAR